MVSGATPRASNHEAFGSAPLSEQRLAGKNPLGFLYVVAKLEMIGRQHDDRRSVLEPPELVALADADIAREDRRPWRSGIEDDIQKMQPDTGHQDRRDRHQGQGFPRLQP